MSVNVQEVELLNQKAQRLNAERQRLIGMKESARNTYDKSVFAYQEKYGVQLDDTNLQQEYNAVKDKMQSDYDKLNRLILSIESGEYKANTPQPTPINTIGASTGRVDSSTPNFSAQPQSVPMQQGNTQYQNTQTHQGVQQASQQNLNPTDMAQMVMQAQNQPVQASQPFVNPLQSQTPVQPQSNGTEDVSDQSFTPQGWGTPKKDINTEFGDILGGNKL